MKIFTPQISWHDRQPILSVDIQNRLHSRKESTQFYRLATGGNDSMVIIWCVSISNSDDPSKKPVENIECLSQLTQHQRSVNVVRFSPNLEDNYLASGDDDSLIFIWKLIVDEDNKNDELQKQNVQENFIDSDVISIEVWKTHKILRGHNQDVLDLCWSKDGQYIVSCSVDNNVFVWDVQRGVKLNKVAKEHSGYVQGVTWDPLNKYIASLSADRNLIIFNSKNGKTLHKISKINFEDDSKFPPNTKLFYDQTMMSFFRRLTFTPGGELLLAPSGIVEIGNEKFDNVVHIFERKSLNRPSYYLPTDKFSVAVKCCPVVFELQDSEENMFNFPYRIVFAVATQDSVLFYDSQQLFPFGYASQLHYLRLTDLAWSSDGRMVIVTSTDGFSSFIVFGENELGVPYQGKLMEFEDLDILNSSISKTKQDLKTPSKSVLNNSISNLDKSAEKESKTKIRTSTPITKFFKKCPSASVDNRGDKKQDNNQTKPGRRVQLITLFKPEEKSSPPPPPPMLPAIIENEGDDDAYVTGMKRKQTSDDVEEKIDQTTTPTTM